MPEVLAWEPITDYEQWWTRFDERFGFRAGIEPVAWPGIREPADSVTFSLEPICQSGSEPKFVAGADALNAEVLRAFVNYIFLGEDLSTGTFGHPWEESLCVFGDRLVEALAPALETWLPVLRRGSVPI